MVELLLAGFVFGLSSASISGLFTISKMQFYRVYVKLGCHYRYPTTTGYQKLIPQNKIPSNLLEIIVLGPDMSMQFIGTRIEILIQKVGEMVIFPGYRPELAFTDDTVIRLELVNNDNPSTRYKITAFQNNSQSVEVAGIIMYLASSQGCVITVLRPSSDGLLGIETTIVTEL